MNIALLFEEDLISTDTAVLTDRRLRHLQQVRDIKLGDQISVGQVNGLLGEATITELAPDSAKLSISWSKQPPAPLPVTLIIALPRPKMVKRIIQTVTTMGVKQLYFINSYKVEKSFWQSPWLTEAKLLENVVLGLEQAMDTQLPTIHLRKRFKPFVEDELPEIAKDSLRLVAHPSNNQNCPIQVEQQTTLAIGPEGGFIPYEVEKLESCGFTPVSLGDRILRTETAVPVLLSKLF
ncbi:16S rRNA (uracil(1498)-N(3))-methyltransferase [Alkalimarinus sediminis]|uniref:Ribosomal RNA small subunit methyltransferase E n=1 Tax=Alkalimarinus sediminis TaxID=1632866 RepID=A0A9E8KP35_9ALTE|nr:16S rRNA (uracil(1498)-N(3))-methyltransferase [Alkalimarinus sediminis]UZW74329.1 16S rRNA (uracil(1498)-N(3))-methyltransferase [Alkalimarinus sediminis]